MESIPFGTGISIDCGINSLATRAASIDRGIDSLARAASIHYGIDFLATRAASIDQFHLEPELVSTVESIP